MVKEVALAACFVAACIVAALAVVRALALILHLVPNSIKLAVVVGMGLLLSLIGLQMVNIVVPNSVSECADLMPTRSLTHHSLE